MAQTALPEDRDGLKVIHAALFRMGTKSMAQAYKILGYETHHGLPEDVTESPWTQIEQAAEATWPKVPGARPRSPNTRKDWDELWESKYDAVTDLSSPFVPELIKAYPNAKVVIVQRNFDAWWPSFKIEILDRVMLQPAATINGFLCRHFLGIRAVEAMRKLHFGFFNAKSKEECAAHARETYDAYFRTIRELVPPERRLEYQMGAGWEPLCAFLDVPVPDVPFPNANEKEAHQQEINARRDKVYHNMAGALRPWIVGATAVGAAYLHYRGR